MLTELRISNFGVIEQLAIRFSSGFIVFTGETGAGKSLLIDAVTLLVGGRASIDHIRAQADEADLEAAFVLASDHSLLQLLQAKGFGRAGETEILIRRVISRTGRNRTYLNGNLCPVHLLEELGGALVDVHGQHGFGQCRRDAGGEARGQRQRPKQACRAPVSDVSEV